MGACNFYGDRLTAAVGAEYYSQEVYVESEYFAEKLTKFVNDEFLSPYIEEDLVEVKIRCGYYNGFEMALSDCWKEDRALFIADSVKQYPMACWSDVDPASTVGDYKKALERSIDFAEYALVRFAYNQGLGFACGGWCGGVADLALADVSEREQVGFNDLWKQLGC